MGWPIFLAALSLFCLRPSSEGSLVIQLDNVQVDAGMVWVALYASPDAFLDKERALLHGFKVERRGQLFLRLEKVPFGTYALALFHDENNNGHMDRGWLGLPREPYGFSRPPRSKWRLPRFDEMQFTFAHSGQQLQVTLQRW